MSTIKKIAVLGDGGWGTTLALHLAKKNYPVRLWGAFPDYIDEVKKTRINSRYLPGIRIPEEVLLTADLKEALKDCGIVVLAVPSQFASGVLKQIKPFDLSKKIFLSVIKGIDNENLMRMSEIIGEILGGVRLAVLSGPTIAGEVAKGIPTTAVIASKDAKITKELQNIFNSKSFRIYTNSDVIGVEIGGSIKNIIAIACGVCDGLGFGTNAKAAILTRGLAEMARLGVKLGAKAETFSGLTGLGDLVTTCVNQNSRNRSVGELLGQGRTIEEITSSMEAVAEGVATVKPVYRLSVKKKVPMPITTEVYNIIYKKKDPRKAVEDLMSRKVGAE